MHIPSKSKLHHRISTLALAACGLLALSTAPGVQAAPSITNGGFESGLAGWSLANQFGSDGTFWLQSGTVSPVLGDPVPLPSQGSNAAMSDGAAPGSHLLYQDFVASAGPVTLRFDLFIGNRGVDFTNPGNLNFENFALGVFNQQVRVDIITTSANLFSVAPAEVLLNLYQSKAGDPLVSGYSTISTDLTALMSAYNGQTLRLRFAEVDTLPLQLGVDNVLFAVPEPGTWTLMLLGLGLMAQRARHARRARIAEGPRRVSALAPVNALAMSAVVVTVLLPGLARADTTPLVMLDPTLQATPLMNSGISQPIGIVFRRTAGDFFVLEKASGQIKQVLNNVLQPTPVLDLAVNSNSERGLLSMVLHPRFESGIPYAYVRWTESSTGTDSTVAGEVPLLGNRVDRFLWNGSSFVFDSNIIKLRARQTDNIAVNGQLPDSANPAENGNHNGGVICFGPDGKLYIFMGDQGRRGWLQNLVNGPFLSAPQVDDTFGGPAPDNAHLTGVILRLSDDGSTPPDNPFFAAGASIGGEVGGNIQKIYSYGHRNGFGMAFDPLSGYLWETENADDAYSEINRVVPGMNGGWIQFAGPVSRVRDWKTIEMTQFGLALQQRRYPPSRAVYTPAAALARLFMLPGAVYKDPELSWRFESGPSGAAFVRGDTLGTAYNGTFWVGSSRGFSQVGGTGGALYRFKLTADRLNIDTSADPRLADKVADNLFRPQKYEGTESETLIIGRGFGTVTDIQQGPDGNLYVVSLTDNAIYKISRAP